MPRRKKGSPGDHRGVAIVKRKLPSGKTSWRAKWIDPDTGKTVWRTLNGRLKLTSSEAREAWAIQRAKTLAARRAQLEAGAPKKTHTPFSDALKDYWRRREEELRPATVTTYQKGLDLFEAWAERSGVKYVEDLTVPLLESFRSELVSRPRHIVKDGGKRGERSAGSGKRSPVTVNRDLRSIKTFLADARRLGLLPRLDSDGIGDGLRSMKAPRPLPEFLRTPDLRRLLQAARRHDAATFAETRGEHQGKGKKGTTAKYQPVSQFSTALLLSGARFNELARLEWRDVDLDAEEILIRPEKSKTGIARRVDLSVSPGLVALLAALRLRARGARFVFGGSEPVSYNLAKSTHKRLIRDFGAPEAFTWQMLRRSCGTYITCSGVFGKAGAWMSAKQLGHTVMVAERYYVGAIKDVPQDAKTVEDAMQIADLVGEVVECVSSGSRPARRAAAQA